MTSEYVKRRLQSVVDRYPRNGSNDPVLEVCREFAEEAFVAGISMAFQEWIANHVDSIQRARVSQYLTARLPGIILNQYLPAQQLLDDVDLRGQLIQWTIDNPTWKQEVQDAAFDAAKLCDVVNRLYYSLLEYSKKKRG